MKLLVCCIGALGALLFADAFAAPVADSTEQQLKRLEIKYFGHQYESDSDSRRTQRLESFVFGEPSQGELNRRVAALSAVADQSERSQNSGGKGAQPPVARQRSETAQIDPGAPASEVGGDRQSTSTVKSDTAFGRQTSHQAPAADATADYPRVTALENAILGRSFAGRPLAERLGRMERKAFGTVSTDVDLSARTDELEKYARQKLHKDIAADETQTAQPHRQNQGQQAQQVATMLGRTLLGLTGFGTAGIGSSTSGAPGFGPNLGPGFRNKGVKQRPEEKAENHPEADKDDPALLSPNPPGPQAKLLTKVGWCEMRVLGQTYKEMHLPDRLAQLNQQLHFCPARTGVYLMDHISDLMKSAQATPALNRPVPTAASSQDD